MSYQEHIQKKPLFSPQQVQGSTSYKSTQNELDESSKQQPQQPQDFKTQLSRAVRFGHNLSKISVPTSSPSTATVQTKATIIRQGKQIIQPLQLQEEPEQMKSERSAPTSILSTDSSNSMPEVERAKMKNSFSTNFSDANIETESALGHELTHMVQQRAGRVPIPQQRKGAPINADPALEAEADKIGAKAAQGEQVQVPNVALASVASDALAVQNSTKPIQLVRGVGGGMYRGGGRGGRGGRSHPYNRPSQKDKDAKDNLGRPIDKRGRVLTEDGNVIKHYAIPIDPEGKVVLPVKNEMNPYRPKEPAFLGGLPTLPGGNMDKKHMSSTQVLDDEMDEELRKEYKRVEGKDPELLSSREDEKQKQQYNFHKVFVEPQTPPDQLPNKPEYRETKHVFTLDPKSKDFKNLEDSEIRNHILETAGINKDRLPPDSLNDFAKSHAITALVEYLKSV